METLVNDVKHFYQEATFYISVLIPVLGLIIDMIDNELKTGNAVSAPYTVLLTKLVAGLTAAYVFGRRYQLAHSQPVVVSKAPAASGVSN